MKTGEDKKWLGSSIRENQKLQIRNNHSNGLHESQTPKDNISQRIGKNCVGRKVKAGLKSKLGVFNEIKYLNTKKLLIYASE